MPLGSNCTFNRIRCYHASKK